MMLFWKISAWVLKMHRGSKMHERRTVYLNKNSVDYMCTIAFYCQPGMGPLLCALSFSFSLLYIIDTCDIYLTYIVAFTYTFT